MSREKVDPRIGLWIFMAVTAFFLFMIVLIARPFIVALIAGGMMALILNPWFRVLLRRMPRYVAAAVATLSMAILVIVPMLVLAGVALRDATTFTNYLSSEASHALFRDWWSHWQVTLEGTARTYLPWFEGLDLEDNAILAIKMLLDWTSSTVIRIAGDTPALILQLVMGILSCYFFLVDGPSFLGWLKKILPMSQSIQSEIAKSFRDATRSTLMASLAAALAQAAVVVLTFLMLGIPGAALATGATFVFAWIPVLGSAPVFLLAAIWAIIQKAWWSLAIILVASVITGLIDNFIRPLVLKGGSDMHPLISLVAILGGVEFFGLLGVLLGPVIVAMFLACAKVWPYFLRRSASTNQ
jgi:predicted PurR-regulated permease PerM